MNISILHISDLHRDPQNPISNRVLIDSLEKDRDRYTSPGKPTIHAPNLIIISGDIVQGVKHGEPNPESTLRKQYDEALDFLNELTNRFVSGDKRRVVIVPGNHDVSDYAFRRSIQAIEITADRKKTLIPQLFSTNSLYRWSWNDLMLYEIFDLEQYNKRFEPFTDFYTSFYEGQRSYSINPSEQVDVFDLTNLGIAIVGFCSCYNNDLLNKLGAIHPECIVEAGKQLHDSKSSNKPLLIAVWHHNAEGPPQENDYMDPDIVQNLIDRGFSLGFHGHQHKPQFLDTRFRHGLDRRITVISAGTLCGGAAFRYARSYNVVEIDIENRTGRLHLREMQNDNLLMPIWGVRSLPPNQMGCLEFTFDPPLEPLVQSDSNTLVLNQARDLYEKTEYAEAIKVLSPIAPIEPLARRLLLDCEISCNNWSGIIATFDPPQSSAEALALMDALWTENKKERLAEILTLPLVADSSDPSVKEMRGKYTARLKK